MQATFPPRSSPEPGTFTAQKNSAELIAADDPPGNELMPRGQMLNPSDSISLYPSLLPTFGQQEVKNRLLAAVDSKDRYSITPLLNQESGLQLLEKIQQQLTGLVDQGINNHVDNLLNGFRAAGPEISIELWASLSIQLQGLSTLLQHQPDSALPSLAYIKLIVNKMDTACRFAWMQLAYEKIIQQFTQALINLIVTNSAENYIRSAKGTIEISTPLDIVTVNGSVGRQVSFGFDDEGYGKTYDTIIGDVGINVGNIKGIPGLKFGGLVTHNTGKYHYCRTARDHAVCYFNTMLANNQHVPEIARYLSRRRTLGVLDNLTNEIADFYGAQKDFVLTGKKIAEHFSLFLSLDYADRLIETNPAPGEGGPATKTASATLKENQSRPHPPKITANIGAVEGNKKQAVVVHGTIKTTAGALSGKVGIDIGIYEGSATLAGGWSNRVTQNTRYATLCELLDNEFANSNSAFKKKLRRDVRATGLAIRKKIHSVWYPKSSTRSNFDGATCTLLAVAYQRTPDSFTQSMLRRLGREPAFIQHHNHWVPEICIQSDVDRLSGDLDFLENLHAQRTTTNTNVEPAIAGFYALYGARTVEECLKNMAVLAAYCYGLPGIKEQTTQATRLKNLETRIYLTGIPHQPQVLRKLAGASQTYRSVTSDKTVEFTLKNGFKLWQARATGPALGFKANRKDVTHYNPSRSGKYTNLEITLSGAAGVDRKIIKALCSYLSYEGANDVLELFNSEYLMNWSAKGSFLVRYFQPKDPGEMPTVKLDQRLLKQTGFEFNPSFPIVVSGFGNLSPGVNYSGSTTRLIQDLPSPDTMYYFNLHYMHALFTETIPFDKATLAEKTGEDIQMSYWQVLVDKQRSALEQLFVNIAQGKLAKEFSQLRQRYLSYGATRTQIETVATAESRFIASATQFQVTSDDINYDIAIEEFKKFMRTLYAHWKWTRELSEAFDPYQYEFNRDAQSTRLAIFF